jgi:hypothetical protein
MIKLKNIRIIYCLQNNKNNKLVFHNIEKYFIELPNEQVNKLSTMIDRHAKANLLKNLVYILTPRTTLNMK